MFKNRLESYRAFKLSVLRWSRASQSPYMKKIYFLYKILLYIPLIYYDFLIPIIWYMVCGIYIYIYGIYGIYVVRRGAVPTNPLEAALPTVCTEQGRAVFLQ